MKWMQLAGVVLGVIVMACLAGAAFAELPAKHETFWKKNKNYQAMYDLYDLAQTNAYNVLDKKEYDTLEKQGAAAIAASVKKGLASGQNEADAYAVAYGEQTLRTMQASTWKSAKSNTLEGFYELESDTLAGCLTIEFDDSQKNYAVTFVVWEKAQPGKSGRCYANVKKLQAQFTTSGVQKATNVGYDTKKNVQLDFSIQDDTATVKTTDAFRKGFYVFSGHDDSVVKSNVAIAGKYRLRKK